MTWQSTLEQTKHVDVPLNKNTLDLKDALCIILLCVITLLTWIPRRRGPIDTRWDAGVYYVLGTSLAEGKGYRLLNEPGQIQAIQYPPLLPAIVAVHQWILRTSDPVVVGLWLRRSWIVLSCLYIPCTFLLARLFLPWYYALLLSSVCALNFEMCFLSTLCFAELPFALLSTLSAFLYCRSSSSMTRLLAGSAAIACYLLRTVGVTLLVAWIADAVLRKQFRRAALRAAVALVPIFLWQFYIHKVESGQEYKHPAYAYQRDPSSFYNVSYATNVSLKAPFEPELGRANVRDLMIRFVKNAATMPHFLGESVTAYDWIIEKHLHVLTMRLKLGTSPQWCVPVIQNVLGCLVIAGVVWQFWRKQWFIATYTTLTIVAVSSSPWPEQFVRYFTPLVPFLLLALFSWLLWIEKASRRFLPSVPGKVVRAVVIVIAVCFAFEVPASFFSGIKHFGGRGAYKDAAGQQHGYLLFWYTNTSYEYETALKWLAAHSDRRAIVGASMPQWVYLKTGMSTVMPPYEFGKDGQVTLQLMDSVPVNYLVVGDDLTNKRLPGLVRNSPDKWRLVYAPGDGTVQVYQRVGLQG